MLAAMAKKRKAARSKPGPARSKKAGAPPSNRPTSGRVRRRQKRAGSAVSKGTTVFQTDHGPRAAWPASTSKRKKR
jgi:hypothetical protein